MAGRGPVAAARAYGNAWADAQAKVAASWHAVPAATLQARARTNALAFKISVYYAIFLEWSLDQDDGLPEATPLEQLFRCPRPPPVPQHCFATDRAGQERCIRCLMPPGLCDGRLCRPQGALGHKLATIGSGVFCRVCGLYSFQELNLLKAQCRGPPAAHGGNAHRLRKLLDGVHPRTGEHIGPPQAIEIALDSYSIILGKGDDDDDGLQLMSCPPAVASARPRFWPSFRNVEGR